MSISQATRRLVAARVDAEAVATKRVYAERIGTIQSVVTPPLSNVELSVGLELDEARTGHQIGTSVGRFLSTSDRHRRSRPDRHTRALIDALIAGDLLLCVERAVMPGARRNVFVGDAVEARRLGADWELFNLGGGPVPSRGIALNDVDLEDDDMWSGGAVSRARKAPVQRPVPRKPAAPPASGFQVFGDWQARAFGNTGWRLPALGLGGMRLSTAGRPDTRDAVALIHRALDSGVRLIDTADSYCVDSDDMHHNENLIGEALRMWDGPRDAVRVASKAGLTRPGGRWIPDVRPEHLTAACERSLAALGVEAIDLYQLHVTTKSVPIEESLGALARLRERGLILQIGVCNVTVPELERIESIGIASVQNALSVLDKAGLGRGVVEWCAARDIAFIAHSPLGGHRRKGRLAGRPELVETDASPEEVALRWLMGLAPNLFVIPGVRSEASLESTLRVAGLELSDARHAAIDKAAGATTLRATLAADAARRAEGAAEGEVVLVIGSPAAGKTSWVAPLVEAGYTRINRDELGGTLDKLVNHARRAWEEDGARRFVLDNTYPTRKSRRAILNFAAEVGVPARVVHVDTPLEEAQVNAAKRMLEREGELLGPDAIKTASKRDPNMFPPVVLFRHRELFEPPAEDEGITAIERAPFARRWPDAHVHGALLLDIDGTLRRTRSGAPYPHTPDDVVLLPGRREVLADWVARGVPLLGVSNQSGIASGRVDEDSVAACFARTVELLDLPLEIIWCPHRSGAAVCWCRKPMPGLGVRWVIERKLDPSSCTMVGDLDSDRVFAETLGMTFAWAADFFGDTGSGS